jgi:hypothetical protein
MGHLGWRPRYDSRRPHHCDARTAEWLRAQGATVLKMIEDPLYGHGALVLNETNARMVLDLFFDLFR